MSSEDYRALFKQANDAIALVEFQDGTPIIEAVNSTFRETFVPDDSDVIGRDIDELVAEGDRREAAKTLSQRVRKGEVTREFTARDTVVGTRHFDCQVIPVDAATIEDADHAFAIYTDVTERIERKRALEESEERYRQLVATAPTPILIYDGSEKVVYANDAAVELFGAENEEELLGLTPPDFVHPDSRDELDDRRHRLIDEKQSVPPNELTLLDRNGREKTVLVTSSPVTYEGEPAIQTVATDITELKDRERHLERYETLVEVSGDPMYMLDSDGRFRYVNEALLDLTGHTEDDLLGEHVEVVMDAEDVEKGEEVIRLLLDSGDRRGTFEMDLVTADGNQIPSENHVSLLFDDGDFDGTVGVLRDISARLRRERQLQRERDRLDEFAGVVSHDLRNPLNVAEGRLELAAEDCDSDDLEAVARAHDRMEVLIEDLLELARAGSDMGDPEPIDLAEFLQNCWRNVESENATLELEVDGSIQADKSRLKQLFENLFRNAVEHVGPDVTVSVGDLWNGFYVEDDGAGFDEGELDRVLEPGYSSSEGTGFGLSIVRSIAEAHGWSLAVSNGADGGARFEFTGVFK